MLNPQKSYIIPHNHSLTTDDLGFILPIEQNPLVSFENSLEFPSPFIKPSSRPKSYSFDLYEYRDFFHPLAFLKRMELEVKRLLPELRLFLYDTHNFLVIPFFLTNEIKSICLKIFNANIYELSSFQVKNALMAFEKLLSQFTKEIDSPDLHKESPNSLINTPEKKDFKGFSSQMEMNSPKPYSRESLKKKRTHPQYFSMQILRKTVFLLSKIGHLIHWRDISNGVTLGDFLLNKRELSQEEEFIMKQTLQRYFNWKLNHWKRENNKRFVINNEKNCFVEDRMICKICLKAIIIMKMPLHSELCMERSEVVRQIESLKSYFNRYCVKSNKNARYFEKVYGIQKKKKPSNSPLKISENLTIKHKKALTNTKNIKNKLKLKIYAEDNKIQGRYLDELSEKIENFPYNSPLNLQAQKNPILSEEKLTLIYRKIKLYDLIAKASSFFINEEMNQKTLLKLAETNDFFSKLTLKENTLTLEIDNFTEYLNLLKEYHLTGQRLLQLLKELDILLPLNKKSFPGHYDSDTTGTSKKKLLKTSSKRLSPGLTPPLNSKSISRSRQQKGFTLILRPLKKV